MGFLRKSSLLSAYEQKQSTLLQEGAERIYAGNRLREVGEGFSFAETYDIFLSHSYDDARVIKEIYDMLAGEGNKVTSIGFRTAILTALP